MIVQLHFLFDSIVDFTFGMYYDKKAKKVSSVRHKLLLESAGSLAEKIRTKLFTSEEIVRTYIEKCKEVNGLINAIMEDRYSDAIEEAKSNGYHDSKMCGFGENNAILRSTLYHEEKQSD